MTEAKTNFTIEDVSAIETALETSAAINATTIKLLERIGQHRAADALRLQANLIAVGRDALSPPPVRLPRAGTLHAASVRGHMAIEDALRVAVDLDAPNDQAQAG